MNSRVLSMAQSSSHEAIGGDFGGGDVALGLLALGGRRRAADGAVEKILDRAVEIDRLALFGECQLSFGAVDALVHFPGLALQALLLFAKKRTFFLALEDPL